MSFWNPSSISGKLTRTNVLVCGIALLLAYGFFLAFDLYSIRQNMIYSLDAEAAMIGENSVTALTFDDPQAAENTLAGLSQSPHVISAVITEPDGVMFAEYHTQNASANTNYAESDLNGHTGHWTRNGNLFVQHEIWFQGKSLGTVVLEAETSQLAQSARQFGVISAIILLLCFLAAIVATTSIRRLITDPLSNLAGTAQLVSREKNYSVRAEAPQSGDELAFLVDSFNEMLDQIQQRDQALEESRTVLEQRVRERTAELSAAYKELEAFSYSVAHDLRGPLQQITNIAFLLQLRVAEAGNSEGANLVGKISDGSKRMSRLIDDLLNLSRATSTPLHRTSIDLSAMAQRIVDQLKIENPERHVEINFEKDAHIIADEGLMALALENLIRNAWKYTSKRENGRIDFAFRTEGPDTVFVVRDNGVGFDPQYVDRLFRPFQRLHSQSEFPGTGVGLATVQRIIARHGGRIWATGELDRGAEFTFTLPNIASEDTAE
jgi:signal transduction histidine kinase